MIDYHYSTAPDAVGVILLIGIFGIAGILILPLMANTVSIPEDVAFEYTVPMKEYFVLPMQVDDPDFDVSDIHGVIIDTNGTRYQTDSTSSLWLQSYYSTHPFVEGQEFVISGYMNPRVKAPHVTDIRDINV